MPFSLAPRYLVALVAALALSLPSVPARAKEDPEKAARRAEKEAQEDAKRAAEAEKAEAKRERKRSKEEKSASSSRDAKRRAQIESGARTAVDWYAEALGLYQRGRYLDARSILLPLEDSARAVDIQEKVKLLIADTYFEQGGALNLAEALARYKSYLTFFPGSENAAYAQYQLGRSYFKQLNHPDRDQSFTDQAIFEYEKLIENYPSSEYVAAAQKDVLEAKARRAQHEFEVAQFYWDWNDKGAAAKRLQQVLKERPELPAREKALWMCAQALYDIGEREEGDAYAARLAADYPGSSNISKLNPDSPGAIEKQVARERKNDKEAERLRKAQAKQDRRRTRIVRKDSGLPADVPQTWDLSGSTTPPPPTPAAAPAAAAAPGSAAAAPASAPAPAPAPAAMSSGEMEKQRKREEAQRAQSEKLEREEQERKAKNAEREAKKAAAEEAEAAKRAAKRAKDDQAVAEETPKQKAEREKAEARAKKEAERLEAEEAKEAAKKAEAEAKRKEKQEAEDAKKAAKKRAKGKG